MNAALEPPSAVAAAARSEFPEVFTPKVRLVRLYVSPGHNYIGHHGRPPGAHPIHEVPEVRCLAGRGIVGDRFLDHRENYKGQITFFAEEVYHALCVQLGRRDKPPSVFRRNVLTRGLNLNELIGREFAIQDVRFFGVEPCKPCYWMDHAFGPGAEAALAGRGGLRARTGEILTADLQIRGSRLNSRHG